MNSRQKEVLNVSLQEEQEIFKALERNYTAALADVKRNIRELQANPLTQSKAYQLEFQKQLEKQISGILDNLQGKNFTSIADYLQKAYTTGFIGTMYDMQGQGVPLVIPMDEKQVLKAVQKTGDDFKLSTKLGGSTQKLKEQVKTELVRGFATELSYSQIARNISDYGESNMHRAMNIARTEGHRVQNTARLDSMNAAKSKGADIVKQWDATLDGNTRPEHASLDGQIRELDEDFTVGGYSASSPGGFGVAYMDCNCRCCMLQRARWAVKGETTYQKWNNETGGLIECSGYEDFKEKYLKSSETLKKSQKSGTIKSKETIQVLDKLRSSGMGETEYNEYLNILNAHNNTDVVRLYNVHADEISKVTYSSGRGVYQPSTNSLAFDYPQYSDMSKYGTLTHEYGHFFDAQVKYDGLHFKEIKAVQDATGLKAIFKDVASSSDEFLAAIRKDKEHIRNILTLEAKTDLAAHNASHGVQDAIDGLFSKSRIRWGHGERYYNRKYADVDYMDKMTSTSSKKKALQQAYKDLGFDASNQAKTKTICRQYDAASEAWANIMSAEVCGGEDLEYIKKYLPNSYQAFLNILKGAK